MTVLENRGTEESREGGIGGMEERKGEWMRENDGNESIYYV